jgi:hypothetical protein
MMGTTSGSPRKYVQFDTNELSAALVALLEANGWNAKGRDIDVEIRNDKAVITIWND